VRRVVLALAAAFVLVACPRGPESGPIDVVWDRDVCARCNMAISDRHFAAQIRTTSDHRAHTFDDLGCALLWLDGEGEELGGAEEIWVRDREGAGWLDARAAHFVAKEHTPMNYGFGAVDDAAEESLTLEEVRVRVRKVEGGRRARHH
jgi:nitrous oxide reductase accessory protein NosL